MIGNQLDRMKWWVMQKIATNPLITAIIHDVQQHTRDGGTYYCSFCGQSQHEVRRLLAHSTACICNECIVLFMDMLDDIDMDAQTAPREGTGIQ